MAGSGAPAMTADGVVNTTPAVALRTLTLLSICVMAFCVRLFSVIKYESVIHEFDPYFNYRVTQYLTREGAYSLWNWFDERTWYPLGRVIGGTVYPGLIWTAGSLYTILHWLNIPIHVQEVCVFTAPLFSAFCSLAMYGLVKEARSEGAGLLAAAFIAVVPSYISRSVAGSFDNEGVAIFALVNIFYLFIKTVNTGSTFWAVMSILGYLYMVGSWGGYSFVINLLPIYCLMCIFTGRLSSRLYVAFSPLVVIGTLLAASIPVVGFNAVLMSEHFGAFLAWGVLHAAVITQFVRSKLSQRHFEIVRFFFIATAGVAFALGVMAVLAIALQSPTFGWTGRSLSLLDPTYAGRFIPIIASVSEHQPPNWTSYIMDLQILVMFAPAGLVACFVKRTDASLFLVLFGITSAYFSGVMVRLMLVLAPATCCLAGVGISELLATICRSLRSKSKRRTDVTAAAEALADVAVDDAAATAASTTAAVVPAAAGGKKDKKDAKKDAKKEDKKAVKSVASALYSLPTEVSVAVLGLLAVLLTVYVVHCVHASADMYSSPSIVLLSPRQDGSTYVFDDFREAYSWLRHNTPEDAVVASWWDYGYQTTAMANRTVVVDNNTWNTTHIATVGRAMSSPEKKAWEIYRFLGVDYVFVVFGGAVGYPSDDINKFLWMVRIGGGVYPEIREPDYLAGGQDYRVDAQGTQTMLNTLMYKLSYYDFPEESQLTTGQRGFDRVRNYVIGKLNIRLNYFEEVFTSQHWMMRIYRVRDKPLRDSLRGRKKGAAAKAA